MERKKLYRVVDLAQLSEKERKKIIVVAK